MQTHSIERFSYVDLCFVPAEINASKSLSGSISCFV